MAVSLRPYVRHIPIALMLVVAGAAYTGDLGNPFFGSDTWPMNDLDPVIAKGYLRGGATVWQAPAIDPELGMMYFTTGNASPYGGDMRKGDNLFTSSILVPYILPWTSAHSRNPDGCRSRVCVKAVSSTK